MNNYKIFTHGGLVVPVIIGVCKFLPTETKKLETKKLETKKLETKKLETKKIEPIELCPTWFF